MMQPYTPPAGLNKNWTYEQVMPEFEKFLNASGGHTKANTDEAKNYLVSVGFDPGQVDQWYDQWKAGQGAATKPPPPPTQTSSSSSVNPTTGATTVTTNTTAAQTPTGESFDPVAFNKMYQDAVADVPTPEIERVVADNPDAKTFEVPYEHTSAGIMERLLAAEGPYIKQARTRALESMSDRGLGSSSLAAGAGEEAAIGRAFDIGSRDAGIYGDQRIANMDAINNMANANANRSLDAGKTNAGAFNTLARDKFSSQLDAADKAFDTSLDITKAKVQSELGRGDTMLEYELGNLNAARDNAYKRGDMKMAADLDIKIDNARQTLAYDISNLTTARDNAYKQGDMRLAAQLDEQLYSAKANLDASIRTDFARLQSQLDYESKASLAAIEHNYGQVARYSTSASNLMIAMFQSINLVLADPNMDQGNKQGMIDRIVNNYDGIMAGLSSMVVPEGEG